MDLAKAFAPECDHPVVGIRPGGKIHEEMITTSDSFNTVDLGKCFAILPTTGEVTPYQYGNQNHCKMVPPGYAYNSGSNQDFLTVDQLRELIRRMYILI